MYRTRKLWRVRASRTVRQPKAEEREVAAEETEHEEDRHEWREAVGQVKRPAETGGNGCRHADEVNRECFAASNLLRHRWHSQAAEDRADREEARGDRRHLARIDWRHASFRRQLDNCRRFIHGPGP